MTRLLSTHQFLLQLFHRSSKWKSGEPSPDMLKLYAKRTTRGSRGNTLIMIIASLFVLLPVRTLATRMVELSFRDLRHPFKETEYELLIKALSRTARACEGVLMIVPH